MKAYKFHNRRFENILIEAFGVPREKLRFLYFTFLVKRINQEFAGLLNTGIFVLEEMEAHIKCHHIEYGHEYLEQGKKEIHVDMGILNRGCQTSETYPYRRSK